MKFKEMIFLITLIKRLEEKGCKINVINGELSIKLPNNEFNRVVKIENENEFYDFVNYFIKENI